MYDHIHKHTHTHAHTHTYIGADAVFIGCDDVVQARTVRKLVELGADLNASTSRGWCVCEKDCVREGERERESICVCVCVGADCNASTFLGWCV